PDPEPAPEPGPEPAPGDRPPWPAWTAPAALFLAIALALMLGSVAYVIVAGLTGGGQKSAGANIVATILNDAGSTGAAVFFAQMAGRPTPAQFGLRPTPVRPALLWMGAAYLVFFLFAAGWLAALGVDAKDHTLDEFQSSSAAIAGAAVLVTVIAP